MQTKTDVVVFGSCMIDLICYTPRLPKPGETLHGTDFNVGNGGKGANQCVAATKLGASTALIARLGNDSFGKNYKESLKAIGINTEYIQLMENISSGMAQITVSEKGENVIIIVAGANNKLSFSDANKAEDLLINSKVVIFQFETPLESTIETLEFIKREGGPYTIVNGAPAVKNVNSKLYKLCDLFCVNESEAEAITGIKINSVSEALTALKMFHSYGCRTVVITLGKDGAVFSENDEHAGEHVCSPSVSAVDTTGAGDAFIGALAYYTARCPNISLADKISRACKIASFSVQAKGTQSSFPFKKDLPSDLFNDEN